VFISSHADYDDVGDARLSVGLYANAIRAQAAAAADETTRSYPLPESSMPFAVRRS
jgi:hypothetical protein